MSVKQGLLGIAALVLVLGYAATAQAGTSCTDGIDCYCDCVRNGSTPACTSKYGADITDPKVLLCEDFEAVTLHDDTGVGDHINAGGQNVHGPWYDGRAGWRGASSYWAKTYGPMGVSCGPSDGQPANPIVGEPCPAGAACTISEWRADNRWQTNDTACVDIVRDGEFDDELGAAKAPDPVVPGSHAGAFDGKQSLSHRVPRGYVSGNGSRRGWSTTKTIGVSMALAYPLNSKASGIWNHPWKHNEWTTGNDRDDGWFLFHNTTNLGDADPFNSQFLWLADGVSNADCQAGIAGANVRRGTLSCLGTVAIEVAPDPGEGFYQRSRDFPLGTWGCVRGYMKDLGTANTLYQIWFNDTLIVDITFDSAIIAAKSGYKGMMWNSYPNANQRVGGETPTVETTYRYEDNVHVTAGPPAECRFGGEVLGGPLPDPPPADDPPPANDPPPADDPPPGGGGGLALSVSTSSVSGGVDVVASVAGGIGPYQYLFDCESDGHWDGIRSTSDTTSSYVCSQATAVTAYVWDQGSGAVITETAEPTSTSLGAPGKPAVQLN